MSGGLPERTGPLRIGDAERDEAVGALGEHFVAGRLTQEEFEERSDQATRARYADELSPLFADLPDPVTSRRDLPTWQPGPRPELRRSWPVPPPHFVLAPVLLVGLVAAAVLLAAPGILWLLLWLVLFSRPYHQRRHHPWHHRQRVERGLRGLPGPGRTQPSGH